MHLSSCRASLRRAPKNHRIETPGDLDTARVLLQHGADVNIIAKPHDWSPLYAALISNREEMVGMLLDFGAQPAIVKARHGHLSSSIIEALNQQVRRRAVAAAEAAARRRSSRQLQNMAQTVPATLAPTGVRMRAFASLGGQLWRSPTESLSEKSARSPKLGSPKIWGRTA